MTSSVLSKWCVMKTKKGLVMEPLYYVKRHGVKGKIIFTGNKISCQKIINENEN